MPHRYIIRRLRRFFIYRVLHVDDTPHRIALGIAVGIFITWTPTFGMQMILTVLISALVGANKFVGVPFVWISNPFTAGLVYGPNYFIGSYLLGGNYNWSKFFDATGAAMNFSGGWVARIQSWWTATSEILLPLWLGSVIVAVTLAVLTYFTISYIVTAYRQRTHRRGLRVKGPQPQTPTS